ncbi:hypothetical protein [Henriciella sp.]|uniref:hypothetical protein n=1 Tax=Henriciella sp. TaxID=1968823 RepID=UPI00261B569A|nr:hypothetical protein [Henriciella sp.]
MPNQYSDDLAYVREVAEAGISAPLLGGRFLVWWGGLVTAAYIGHYIIISGTAGLGMDWLGIMWLAFITLGLGGYFTLMRLFPTDKPGASSVGNRVSETVWMASGFVLFSFFAGVTLKSALEGQASIGFNWSIPLVLGVYGISQLVSGLMAKSKALVFAGYGAIASVGLTALIVDQMELYLAAAAAAAVTVLIPGILMLRNEPSTTV